MSDHHPTDDQRVEELLSPLADIPPVPYREQRSPARRGWLRPALVVAGATAVVVAVGAVIVTAGGSGSGSGPAATTPPPTTLPAAPDLGVWFVRDGQLVRVPTADPGGAGGAEQRALEALLAGPPADATSAVAPGTTLESFALADTIATIALSGSAPEGQALEQVVATVTDSGAAHWVRLGDEPGLVNRTIAAGQPDDAPAIELVRAQYDGSKVQVAGTADVFEATVQLRLMRGDEELARTFVTATCGTGCRGSFEGALEAPADQVAGTITTGTDPLRVEAYTLSAEDGSERDLVELAVTQD